MGCEEISQDLPLWMDDAVMVLVFHVLYMKQDAGFIDVGERWYFLIKCACYVNKQLFVMQHCVENNKLL